MKIRRIEEYYLWSFPEEFFMPLILAMVIFAILFLLGTILYRRYVIRRSQDIDGGELPEPQSLSPSLLRYLWKGELDSHSLIATFFHAAQKGAYSLKWKEESPGCVLTYKDREAFIGLAPEERVALGFNGLPLNQISVRRHMSKMTQKLMDQMEEKLHHCTKEYLSPLKWRTFLGMAIINLFMIGLIVLLTQLESGFSPVFAGACLVLTNLALVALYSFILNRINNASFWYKLRTDLGVLVGLFSITMMMWPVVGMAHALFLYHWVLNTDRYMIPYTAKGLKMKEKIHTFREVLMKKEQPSEQDIPYMIALDIPHADSKRIQQLYMYEDVISSGIAKY